MSIKILISDQIDDIGAKKLKAAGFVVNEHPKIDAETLKNNISEYDALIVRSRTKVSAEIINAGKKLKAVARAGAGLDNIDLDATKKRGITIISSPDSVTSSVAELTVGLILSLLRKIPYADQELKHNRWVKSSIEGNLLRGKTVGIIGAGGRIGFEVSRILTQGFKAKIIGYDVISFKEKSDILGIKIAKDMNQLLRQSDIITIHVPYSPSTHHLIDKPQFMLMKKEVILINTSRGGIINQKELLALLKEGKIRGAGLDVYYREPPQDEWEKEVIAMSHGITVCTCHIGAQTTESQKIAAEDVANQIIVFFKK